MDETIEPRVAAPGGPNGGRSSAGPAIAGALAIVALTMIGAILLVPGLLPGAPETPAPVASCAVSCTPSPPAGTGPGATASAPASFIRPTPMPEPTFVSYVVRPGDSLGSIARTFATTARSLAWWNRGTYPSLDPESGAYDPNHIEPGWTLVVIPGIIVDDLHPPTPSPGLATPSASAGPSASAAASAVAGAPATVISHGSRATARIALTFDMGGRLDPAVAIVQWLIDHGVHATLFPTGEAGTTTDQGRAALQLAASRPDLFSFGNHSWDHPDFTTLTTPQMAAELASTEAAIHDLIGTSTKPYFRPPYGAWNAAVRSGVGAAGWSDLVMWDVDTIDWKSTADGGPTADDIVTKVVAEARGGSIVLMHLGGWHTLDALPDLLAGLKARGLTPITLTEMLGG